MREIFRRPTVQAARTAASLVLMRASDLHRMGIFHIAKRLCDEGCEIVFHNERMNLYPQLKVLDKDGRLRWVVIESAMYPNEPALEKERAKALAHHAAGESASLTYVSVSFINTRSCIPSLASVNGKFIPHLVAIEELELH